LFQEVISPPAKRLEQQNLLVVKLEVISTPIKRLEQQKLLMVKLEVIKTPIKRLEQQDLPSLFAGRLITSSLTISKSC
jgi:hypothetical protein